MQSNYYVVLQQIAVSVKTHNLLEKMQDDSYGLSTERFK